MRHLLTIVSMLLAATAAHAGITQWVDAEGKVHFSDQPAPPTAKSKKTLDIKAKPGASTAAPDDKSGAKSLAERELESRKRRVEAEEAAAKQAKEQQESKQRKENCAQARNQLRALQDGQRISRHNEQGERIFLDDSDRPKAIQDAQQAVDSWCK